MVPFISTQDLGDFLGEDVTGNRLSIIAIDSACQTIRSYVGYKLNYLKDDIIKLDGNGREAVILPEAPVVSVKTVLVGDMELTADDYYFTPGGLLVKMCSAPWLSWPWGGWLWGQRNITVTYSHGYAFREVDVEQDPSDDTPLPDRMPADVRSVALDLAKRIYEASAGIGGAGSSSGISSEQIGTYQYSAGTTTTTSTGASSPGAANVLWPSDKALLAAYKKVGA